MSKPPNQTSQQAAPRAVQQRTTLAIWLPDWPVQRARLEDPKLRGATLVFSAGDGRNERVIACSAESRRLGVAVGMQTPEAESLAGPQRLCVLPHDPAGDRRALLKLAADCERFSPTVSHEDAEWPEALLLDIHGLAPLWADSSRVGEARLAQEVRRWWQSRRLVAAAAIAHNPSLALAVAKHTSASADRDSPTIVEDPRQALMRLPIDSLDADEPTLQRLQSLGLATVSDLLKLPRASLPARFGSELLTSLDRLCGEASRPLVALRDRPPIEERWPFEHAVRNAAVLGSTLHRLIERVCQELRRRGRGALRVLIGFRLDNPRREEQTVALRLFRPTSSATELQELADLQTESLRFADAVACVRVLVGSAAPLDIRQRTLFDDHTQTDAHEQTKLINRLANRVGYENVSRVERRTSVDPTRAYACVAATDTAPQRYPLGPHQTRRLRRLPLAMHRSGDNGPRALRVATHRDSSPASVGDTRVIRSWGPERVETGWWRGRGVRRDAYWVELQNGSRWWLCRELRSGRWRIAGEFL
ncbi:MAG: DNA polymerase Y family protein [Planctomycetota bacterium]